MAYFAEIDENNTVVNVIKASQEFIDSGAAGDPSRWIQASDRTRGGLLYHMGSGTPTGFAGLRKNYPGVGYTYDPDLDAFIPPKPYPSWTLDENTGTWIAPVSRPDGSVTWDEDNQTWVQAEV